MAVGCSIKFEKVTFMKNILKFAFACVVALAVVACGENNKPQTPSIKKQIVNEWHLVESPLFDKNTTDIIDIYIVFNSDLTFTLYQKDLNTPIYYNVYNGSYLIKDDVITGKYSDGKSWAASNGYKVSVDAEGKLTMINVDNTSDISVYAAEVVPEDVKSGVVMTSRGEAMFDVVRFL